MSISGLEKASVNPAKTGFVHLLAALFCVLFGSVYEHFSHGVYSGYMLYAFVFPLAGGTLPYFAISLSGGRHVPGRLAANLYNSGLAALTMGSIFQGVLDIYGTTNGLTAVYWLVGAGLAATGSALYFADSIRGRLEK